MKEFWIYTGMRALLFVAAMFVVVGIWGMVNGDDTVPLVPAAIISILISGLASWFVLGRQREAFARRVEARAAAASAKFEAHKAKEDVD